MMQQLPNPVFAELPAADIAVLVVYIIGIVAFGCGFIRKSSSTSEFMAAGGSLPGWAVGLSIFGTYLSSNTFLGVPGKAYASNWSSFVFSLSLPVAAFLAVKYFVPFYRKSGEISAYQHFEKRFGGWARTYCVICYLATQFVRVGSIMFLVAVALRELTGWDIRYIIIGTGLLVTLYTLLGGIEAVIWTDVAQSIILTIGALLVTALILFDMPGGPSQVFSTALEEGKFSLGSFDLDFTPRDAKPEELVESEAWIPGPTFWCVFLYGLFINLNNFGIDQNFVQRYHTAKSDKEAARSVWLGAIAYVPISLLFFFIGSTLFAYYEHQDNEHLRTEVQIRVAPQNLKNQKSKLEGLTGEEFQTAEAKYIANREAFEAWQAEIEKLDEQKADMTPEEYAAAKPEVPAWVSSLTPTEIGDKVFPHFIVNKLPLPGMAGLLLAAIFAAAMSSVDTSLNSSATVILTDIYKRYVNPDVTEKGQMRVLYGATLFVGFVGTGIGLAMIGIESVLDAWWKLSGIFAGGMLGLFLLSMIARNAKRATAATGVVIGLLVIAWMTFSENIPGDYEYLRNPWHTNMTIVVGTLTIFFVGLITSSIFGNKNHNDLAEDQSNSTSA